MAVLADSAFNAQSLTAWPGRQGNVGQENAGQNVA